MVNYELINLIGYYSAILYLIVSLLSLLFISYLLWKIRNGLIKLNEYLYDFISKFEKPKY